MTSYLFRVKGDSRLPRDTIAHRQADVLVRAGGGGTPRERHRVCHGTKK